MIEIGILDLEIRRPRGSFPTWADEADHRALAEKVQRLVLSMLEELLGPRLPRDEAAIEELVIDMPLKARDLEGAAPLARAGLRAFLGDAVEKAVGRAEPRERDSGTPVVRGDGQAAPDARLGSKTPRTSPDKTYRSAVLALIEALFPGGHAAPAVVLLPETALVRLLRSALSVFPGGGSSHVAVVSAPISHSQGEADAKERRALANKALSELGGAMATHRAAPVEAQRAVERTMARAWSRAKAALTKLEGPVLARTHDATSGRAKKDVGEVTDKKRVDPHKVSVTKATRPQVTTGARTDADPLPNGVYAVDHLLPFLVYVALADRRITRPLALDVENTIAAASLAGAVASICLAKSSPLPDPRVSNSIAHFAGQRDAPDAKDYASAAARIDGAPLARAALAQSLLGSLLPSPTMPLVFLSGRVALFDAGGLYPVASGTPETLVEMLLSLDRMFFVAGEDLDAWALLAKAGVAMIGSGAPVSGEAARLVTGAKGWVGRTTTDRRLPHDALTEEAERAEDALAVWEGLIDAAPVCGPYRTRQTADFVDLAALLAGYGLADLGWRFLSKDPVAWERPDPALVQRRFFDLGGELRVSDRKIDIHLPMGRRYLDLRDAGLLRTVDAPAWWGDRRLVFSGG